MEQALQAPDSGSFISGEDHLKELHDKYMEFSEPKDDYTEDFVDMDGLMHDLAVCLPKDTIITNDAGNFLDGYQDIIVLNKKTHTWDQRRVQWDMDCLLLLGQNWRSLTNRLFLFQGMAAS